MITFDTLGQRLAFGQLKGTSAVDDANLGVLCPEYEDSIRSLANQGLVALTTKFPLITAQVDLTFIADQYVYGMDILYIGTHLTSVSPDSFPEKGFIKVLDIFDEDGLSHPIDTNGHILTPTFDTLRFTAAKILELGEKVRIRYQKTHPEVTTEAPNIYLPPNLETALQLFVAALYISHMNGKDHSAKGDSYYAAYLRHIGEDESRNTSSVSEIQEDTRFEDRGFV